MAMPVRLNARSLAIPFFLILAYSPATPADEVAYGVDAGIGESDNVTLVPTHRVSQTLAITDLDFIVDENRRLFDVSAKGNFSYLDFVQGAYGPELIGRFDGVSHVALVPERLTWVVRDDFGKAAIDPFAATTPANLENINFFSTGPNLVIPVQQSGFVNVDARYARTQYQTSPFDNNQFAGMVAVGKSLSTTSEVSLDGTSERVVFDNTLVNTDFDRSSLYGHYRLDGARTAITLNLGVIEVEQHGQTSAGPLAKLQYLRRLSAALTWTTIAGRSITDASASFSGLQTGPIGIIGNGPASLTSANYTVRSVSSELSYGRNRTTLGLTGIWEKDDYIGVSQLNLTRDTLEFKVERRLSEALTAQLTGQVFRTDYPQQNFEGTDAEVGTRLTFRHGRGFEVRLDYNHGTRRVSGIGYGYEENRVFLTVGYRPKATIRPNDSPGRLARPGPGFTP